MATQMPPFLTVPEAAAHLSMPSSWVYAECRKYANSRGRDGIPSKRFGRAVRIPTDGLMRWLEKR